MDFLFINPVDNWEAAQRKKLEFRLEKNIPNQEMPHIGIAYLIAVAKQHGYSFFYLDMGMDKIGIDDILEIIIQEKPKLIGFTAFTAQVKTAGRIAKVIKEHLPEVFIALGGPHAINIPIETLHEFEAFDCVVCGEGELILPQLLDAIPDLQKVSQISGVVTRHKPFCDAIPIENLDALPFPAWEAFDLERYAGCYPHLTRLELPMSASRGCVYKCSFCSRTLGEMNRRRSVASVLLEMEYNIERFGCESIAFVDETFIFGKKWMREFMDAMKKRGLNKKLTWSCSTRVTGLSLEFLQELRESGCYYIFFGLESASEETLKRINKNTKVKNMLDAVSWTKQAGIIPTGAFILGLPGETEQEVHMAIELGRKLDLYSITFPIAVPFPGTQLRQMALNGEYGLRMLSDDWDDYSKQGEGKGGVMDSIDFPWAERKRLQQYAYAAHPKKILQDYIKTRLTS